MDWIFGIVFPSETFYGVAKSKCAITLEENVDENCKFIWVYRNI